MTRTLDLSFDRIAGASHLDTPLPRVYCLEIVVCECRRHSVSSRSFALHGLFCTSRMLRPDGSATNGRLSCGTGTPCISVTRGEDVLWDPSMANLLLGSG